jgi:hypothetical protein
MCMMSVPRHVAALGLGVLAAGLLSATPAQAGAPLDQGARPLTFALLGDTPYGDMQTV